MTAGKGTCDSDQPRCAAKHSWRANGNHCRQNRCCHLCACGSCRRRCVFSTEIAGCRRLYSVHNSGRLTLMERQWGEAVCDRSSEGVRVAGVQWHSSGRARWTCCRSGWHAWRAWKRPSSGSASASARPGTLCSAAYCMPLLRCAPAHPSEFHWRSLSCGAASPVDERSCCIQWEYPISSCLHVFDSLAYQRGALEHNECAS